MTSSRDRSLQLDKKDFHTNVFELMSSSFRFLQRKKAIIIYCVDSDKINQRDALTWGSVFSLTILCFLVDKDRQLCCVDLKQVTSQARQSNSTSPLTELTSQPIEKITNCHLFAIGQVCKWLLSWAHSGSRNLFFYYYYYYYNDYYYYYHHHHHYHYHYVHQYVKVWVATEHHVVDYSWFLLLLFQCDSNFYICAATPNSILLLRYNSSIGTFCTRKVRKHIFPLVL